MGLRSKIFTLLVTLACLSGILFLTPKLVSFEQNLEDFSEAFTQSLPGKWSLSEGQISFLPFPQFKLQRLGWNVGSLEIESSNSQVFYDWKVSWPPQFSVKGRAESVALELKSSWLDLRPEVRGVLKDWSEQRSLREGKKYPRALAVLTEVMDHGFPIKKGTFTQMQSKISLKNTRFKIGESDIELSYTMTEPSFLGAQVSKCRAIKTVSSEEFWKISLNSKRIDVKSWTMPSQKLSLTGAIKWNGRVSLQSPELALSGKVQELICTKLN